MPNDPTAPPLLHGKPSRGDRQVSLSPLFEGRFGRMFRRLQPAPLLTDEQITQIAEQMRPVAAPGGGGGVPAAQDNPAIPAGYTYFGQFLDHDVTFDPASSLDKINDPDALRDFRTPRYDLDSLYGSGPADEPFQYAKDGSGKLLLSATASGEPDMPRNTEDIAIIGDPRNDENVIVSQLHVAFARLHNKFVDQVTAEGVLPAEQRFAEAQRRTRWHYQWVIVHDYLPRIVGPDLVKKLVVTEKDGDINLKLRHYRAKTRPYMPIEFSAAGFRFGHSMIRGIYNLNSLVTDRPIFAPGDAVGELDDLRGRRALPDQWGIDWSMFFSIGGSTPQPSQKIDATLVPALFDLPGTGPSLPFLNLKRGQAMELPSGQDVARHLKVERVWQAAELGVTAEATPLWFYILKESELDPQVLGSRLGPVGGRIVAEVILGLLGGDPHSYLSQEPTWTPTLPDADGDGTFSLGDLIAFATA
jgi:hypothetical protein